MQLFFLFLAVFTPNIDRLGDDSYAVREWETERCGNPVSAALLPASHADPEVNYRIRTIRGRQLRSMSPEFIERTLQKTDFGEWLDRYFCPGVNLICDEDCYYVIWEQYEYRALLRERWADGFYDAFYHCPDLAGFREYCDFHRQRAPMPRDK